MRVLAERSGMNFVAGEGVHREKITLILNKTPLDEAINLLVRAAGLSYEVIGNSVLIAEADRLKEEVGLSSYVVNLKYAQAGEVADMLKDLTKNVQVDEGGNRLVCYTSPRVILEIERIVKAIDHPHILVLLETRLIEVSMDKLDQYGIKWAELTPVTSGAAYPETPLTEGFRAGKWVKAAVNFDIKLDLLLQNGDARMLMNSKLTTTNNREASLHIGDIVPYTIQSYNMGGTGGAGGNLQIMKENVGVMITMTPHVNDANQITLNLSPEVSNIAGWKGQFGDIPLVRTRKTNTTIRVENGQKVFLAGLLSEEKTMTVHKVPVLGDIPVIGLLFQNKREEIKKNNLIIEVIPRIINNPREIADVLETIDNDSIQVTVLVSANFPWEVTVIGYPVPTPGVILPVQTIPSELTAGNWPLAAFNEGKWQVTIVPNFASGTLPFYQAIFAFDDLGRSSPGDNLIASSGRDTSGCRQGQARL